MKPFVSLLLSAILVAVAAAQANAQTAGAQTHNLQHADRLATAGVVPAQTVKVGDAQFDLSKPFMLDDSHQIAVAWVRLGKKQAIRVLYRSNSQCSWRLCDATTPNHIGKGFHEFDKQMPIAVTLALLRSRNDAGTLKPWFPTANEEVSQNLLAGKLLRLLTSDRDAGIKTGEVLVTGRGYYVTREYASIMPSVPTEFSIVQKHIRAVNGSEVADPAQTILPKQEQLPDLQHEIDSVRFVIPSYAKVSKTNGTMTGRIYMSRDKTLKYFFVEDEQGRVMLSGVEMTDVPVSMLGLRRQYVDVSGMDTPLMEHETQIPEQYGGGRQSRYQLAWPWVRQLPIIRYYYSELNREPPPATE